MLPGPWPGPGRPVSPHRDLGWMSSVQTLHHRSEPVALSPLPLYASALSSVKRGQQGCPSRQSVRDMNRENTHGADSTAFASPGAQHAAATAISPTGGFRPWPWPRAAVGSLDNSIPSARITGPPCAGPAGEGMDRPTETHWTRECCVKRGAGLNPPRGLSVDAAERAKAPLSRLQLP